MALVKLGNKAEKSIVKLNEGGKPTEFYVSGQNYESGLNGTGRVLLVRKDCYGLRAWNNSGGNDYATSDIDSWLNGDYKNLLDADIRAAMGTTKIYYTIGNKIATIAVLERSVFILSSQELGGGYVYASDEGTMLSREVCSLLRIAYINGVACAQWTRSALTINTIHADYLNPDGSAGNGSYGLGTPLGARPAFTLPADLWVTDDGTVIVNTAPTAPSSITVPASVNGGSTVTISWTVASDAEGNLEGYILERSTNGGSSWSQVYQGGARSTTNTVPFGTESVMYRVKAYDTEGLESSWRTSGQAAVNNNTAPTVPGSITVPETVQGGQPLAVTWGASFDGENNLAGYSLERQVDGGAWETVFSGNELTFTDQITKGWQTVAYRVRAYDTANAYSGYAVSVARAVNNNTPPVISCEFPANTSLGVKNEGFTVSYSVSDEEGDRVTVTEAVDGAAMRTFTAELGKEHSFTLAGVDFMRLLNGSHTLTITASDGSTSTAYSLTFSKLVTAASVTLERPMPADGAIAVCALSVSGFIPADAEFKVEVTNNANDDDPVWEDCTAAVRTGGNFPFTNQYASNGFAFSFRLTVKRGPSGQAGYIVSVQGGFQGESQGTITDMVDTAIQAAVLKSWEASY